MKPPDYKTVFESFPGNNILVEPTRNDFIIAGVGNDYCDATFTEKEKIIGQKFFDVFPDNPNDSYPTGVKNLKASFGSVTENKAPHKMYVQKYDVQDTYNDGEFMERYWDPLNSPVLNAAGKVHYIIHQVKDVTSDTKIQEARQQIFAREGFNVKLFNSAAIALFYGPSFVVKYANIKWLSLIGKTETQVMNRSFTSIQNRIDLTFDWPLLKAFTSKQPYVERKVPVKSNEKVRVMDFYFEPVREAWVEACTIVTFAVERD